MIDTLAPERCPACEYGDASRDGNQFRRCSHCGLLFSDMKAADADWYEKSWIYRGHPRPRPLATETILQNWVWSEFLNYAPIQEGGSLLDVGCGVGHFLQAARSRGFEAEGVDFNHQLATLARDVYGVQVTCEDLGSYVKRERTFDYVTAFEVLEHVSNPVSLLCSMGRMGRFVALSVPCADRRPALFCRDIDAPPHHLTLWTKKALSEALTRAGLTPLYTSGEPYAPKHLGIYLASLLSGNYPMKRYVEAMAKRTGLALGSMIHGDAAAPFTLFVLAESERANDRGATRC